MQIWWSSRETNWWKLKAKQKIILNILGAYDKFNHYIVPKQLGCSFFIKKKKEKKIFLCLQIRVDHNIIEINIMMLQGMPHVEN